MIFRGAHIQRDAHGRYGLLSKRILSSNTDELLPSDLLTPTGTPPNNFRPQPILSIQKVRHVADCTHRNPFPVTRARRRETGPASAWLSDVERTTIQTKCSATKPRRHIAWRYEGAWEEGLAQFARERGLCQESIGESSSVSWRWWRPCSSA